MGDILLAYCFLTIHNKVGFYPIFRYISHEVNKLELNMRCGGGRWPLGGSEAGLNLGQVG